MDGLQGHIRQAMAMAGGREAEMARVQPAMADAGRYASVLEELKVDRGGLGSGVFATDAGVTFRQDESRWWNL